MRDGCQRWPSLLRVALRARSNAAAAHRGPHAWRRLLTSRPSSCRVDRFSPPGCSPRAPPLHAQTSLKFKACPPTLRRRSRRLRPTARSSSCAKDRTTSRSASGVSDSPRAALPSPPPPNPSLGPIRHTLTVRRLHTPLQQARSTERSRSLRRDRSSSSRQGSLRSAW